MYLTKPNQTNQILISCTIPSPASSWFPFVPFCSIHYYISPCGFFSNWWFFHRSLDDSKSPQVSRTLLSILTDFCSTVFRMVSILPLISSLLSLFLIFLQTVLSALSRIGITVTIMFHNFFSSPARSRYLSTFLPSFTFTL